MRETAQGSPYQLLPDLDEEAFRALKEDIRLRGVLVPLELDEDGRVLDGHQRRRAIEELEAEEKRQVPYSVVVRPGLSEDDKYAHGLAVNLQRRQLSRGERLGLAIELRRRFRWSTTRLASLLGVDQSTVSRWLSDQDDLPAEVEGDDGRTYRASVWGGVTAHRRDEAAALEAAGTLGARGSTVDVKRALVLARQARLEAPYTELVPDPDAADSGRAEVELRIGSLAEALADLPDASVDLLLTDPPYPREFLECWSLLGDLAARVLKPTGTLLAYSGHRYLDDCLDRLRAGPLYYQWTGAIQFAQHRSVHEVAIFTGWRPVLVLSAWPEWRPRRWATDTWESTQAEKDLHEWQQSLGPVLKMVEDFSDRGDLVVDPFLGSGTTAVAAVRLGRRFVGCDVDEGAVATARRRLGY